MKRISKNIRFQSDKLSRGVQCTVLNLDVSLVSDGRLIIPGRVQPSGSFYYTRRKQNRPDHVETTRLNKTNDGTTFTF